MLQILRELQKERPTWSRLCTAQELPREGNPDTRDTLYYIQICIPQTVKNMHFKKFKTLFWPPTQQLAGISPDNNFFLLILRLCIFVILNFCLLIYVLLIFLHVLNGPLTNGPPKLPSKCLWAYGLSWKKHKNCDEEWKERWGGEH